MKSAGADDHVDLIEAWNRGTVENELRRLRAPRAVERLHPEPWGMLFAFVLPFGGSREMRWALKRRDHKMCTFANQIVTLTTGRATKRWSR